MGVYVTEQNPSKMGWYIHRTSKVTRSTCGNDGSQTYHVEYKMTNTLESSQIGALTVVPEFLRTLVFARPRGDDQFADCTFSPSLDMSR